MEVKECPYCGSPMNPLAITQLSMVGISVTFNRPARPIPLYCQTCNRVFFVIQVNVDYLLGRLELLSPVLEFLNGMFGVSRYKEFLVKHFVAFTKRAGRMGLVGLLQGILRHGLIYDLIFEYQGIRYIISCYKDGKSNKYMCSEVTPA